MNLKALLISFVILLIFPKNMGAQSNCIITILNTLDCKNAVLYDNYIDSICRREKIVHLYYFIGIKSNELKKYSKVIFDKYYDTSLVVSKNQILKWNIKSINQGSLVAFVSNDDVSKIKSIFEVTESDLLTFRTGVNTELKPILFLPQNKNTPSDSFVLNYAFKTKLSPNIRLNAGVKIARNNKELFILEPMFNQKLYQIDIANGSILNSLDLSGELINRDSLTLNLYGEALVNYPHFKDTLTQAVKKVKSSRRFRYINIFYKNNNLYLVGDCEILAFIGNNVPATRSFRIIIKLDSNLQYLNYFLDPKNSYGGGYPDFNTLIVNNSDRIQSRLLSDYNSLTKKNRNIYYKFNYFQHQLQKYDRDSLIIPSDFDGEIYTNRSSYITNIGDKSNPAWLMDPYPYIYYPIDNLYANILNGEITTKSIIKREFYGTIDIKLIDTQAIIHYCSHGIVYKIIFDINSKRIIRNIQLGNLANFNLNVVADENGNSIFFPIDGSDEDYIYFEK